MKNLNDLIKIKNDVLCLGLKSSKTAQEIYSLQHPTIHKRTGNSGINIVLEKKLVLNAIYGESFCEKSPYHIEKTENEFWLFKDKKPACKISVIKAPKWYLCKTKNNVLMSDIALQEGLDVLMSGIWNNCAYFYNGTQCKFCVLGYNKGVEWKKIDDLVETVSRVLKENPDYYLHLTGGNTFDADHGIKYYEKYVKAIKKKCNIPISLEISPPENTAFLDDLINAGANGFSINIEIWNDKKRREICPGKSKIKKELYFKAWKKAVKALGKFKVSSVLIVGLDTSENIKRAIKKMVKIGVKPVLIPFRPFDKCALHNLPLANPAEVFKLSLFAGAELKKANATEKDFVGCEHCGACTTEKDFLLAHKN